jgi:hypothetical protein
MAVDSPAICYSSLRLVYRGKKTALYLLFDQAGEIHFMVLFYDGT